MTPSLRHLSELSEAAHDATFRPRFQAAVLACLDAGESRETILDIVHRAADHAVDFVIRASGRELVVAPPKRHPGKSSNPPKGPK